MTIARIFFPRKLEVGDRCALTGEEKKYVTAVLRLRRDAHMLLFDGAGCEYEAIILGQDHGSVQLEVVARTTIRGNTLQLTLAQSLP